ncbi:hypothetical protein, partial [Brevundimonas naejangsanensis]|uniref:hypothetical protein n=1 Tax=Brevundimonas naejangsanensis TaxID=588932 RepID=UPI0039F69096
MKTTLKLALLASSALFATPVLAQTPPLPPEHHTLDARGVDLVTGRFNLPPDLLNIGSGDGALSSGRFLVQGAWQDPSFRKLYLTSTSATVVQGAISIHFSRSGSTFTPTNNSGQSLKAEGTGYVFTTAGGEETRFSIDTCYTPTGNQCVDQYNIASITKPNGETITYNWTVQSYLRGVDGNGNPIIAYASRLGSVANNFGYRIVYGYVRDSITGGGGTLSTRLGEWKANTSATAYNEALELSTYVPQTLAFSGDTFSNIQVTNPAGGVTTYGYNAGQQLVSVRYPGSSTDDISITYEPIYGKVLSLTDATGAWSYSYTDAGTIRTTVATGPLGQSLTVVSNLTIGRATSVTEKVSTTPAVSRTTSYTYDTQRRLKRVTQPEGDYGELTYDTRGNVTQVLHAPKPGTGLENITTSATYPATCANPVTCNLPDSMMDALGNTTSYTYDATHGGVLTITAPAP